MVDTTLTADYLAREFRYDGARARYMNRRLDPTALMSGSLVDIGTTWSDYDGDEAFGDFTVAPGNPPIVTNPNSYEPGLWRSVSGMAAYLHNDHLGTLRRTSSASGESGGSRTFTAFGEKLNAYSDRFGYVGAFGYQWHAEMPYLHVGARYYDPSSGRFLQRDPIGIAGGTNVYAYVQNRSTNRVDPFGLIPMDDPRYPPIPRYDGPLPSPRDVQKGAQWIAGACAIVVGIGGGGVGVGIGAAVGAVIIILDMLEYEDVLPPGADTWEEMIDWPSGSGAG